MKGEYNIEVRNQFICYRFSVQRKFTILRGNTATGKSEFVRLLQDPTSYRYCPIQMSVLPEANYALILKQTSGVIYVLDESYPYIRSHEFTKLLLVSDNYFIIVTRFQLPSIPYSIREIYELSTTEAYIKNFRYETRLSRMYIDTETTFVPELIITEDSKSGYQFFKNIFDNTISARGKSNVESKLKDYARRYNKIAVVVDGAAFGSEIDGLMNTVYALDNEVLVFAEESFEYLLLNCLGTADKDVLENTYNYCDAGRFNSWEQFYTWYIGEITNGVYTKKYLKSDFMRYKRGVLQQLVGLDI